MAPCAPVQPAAPHLLPPAHMLIQLQPQPQSQPPSYPPHPQQLVPTLTQTAPSTHTPYASAPELRAPHMMLQVAFQPASLELAGSCQVSSAKVQSVQSSAPLSARPLMAPSMANRTPSERASSNSGSTDSRQLPRIDFVETISRTLSGLQILLDVHLQPEGCMLASQVPGLSTAAISALSPVSTLSPTSEKCQGVKGHCLMN